MYKKAHKTLLKTTLSLTVFFSSTGFSSNMIDEISTLRELSIEDLADIVVVARKREEPLFSVPSSITVFNYRDIESQDIRSIEEVYGQVPGLYVTGNALTPNRDFRQLVMRGVGANSQLEPSVAIFINGVYAPALAFDAEWLNVERVEVLKGPQGALFGRNTEGGALNIITRNPSEIFQSHLGLQTDEFNTQEFKAYINGALSQEHQVYAQFSALYRQTDGFIENNNSESVPRNEILLNRTNIVIPRTWDHDSSSRREQDKRDTSLVRGSLRFLSNENVDIQLDTDYSRTFGGDQAPGPLADCDCYEVNGDRLFNQKSENHGASITTTWQFNFAQFTSITGWRDLSASLPWDFDGVSSFQGDPRIGNVHDWDTRQQILSEELRFNSYDNETINWLAGLYLFREKNDSNRFYNLPNLDDTSGSDPQQFFDGGWSNPFVNIDRTGQALFGQLTIDVNEALELAFGARYSNETAEVDALARLCVPSQGNSRAGDGSSGPNGGLNTFCSLDQAQAGWEDLTTPIEDSERWESVTTSFSSKYTLATNKMWYFTFAEGFKAGSYQKAPVTVADVAPIAPEEIDSYELGFKGSWFGNRLSLATAIYFIELSDMQLQGAVTRDGVTASAVTNAAEAESNGFELSLKTYLNPNLHLHASYGYNHTEFTDYRINMDVNRSGDSFPNTPRQTLSLLAEHHSALTDNLSLRSYLSYRYVDESYVNDGSNINVPIITVPNWQQWDISFALETKRWRTALFVDNLTDERVVLSRWNSFFAEPKGSFIHDRVAPPRRAGLRFLYHF